MQGHPHKGPAVLQLPKRSITYLKCKYLCTTFNNPFKVCILNKKYPVTIQTHTAQIVNSIFLTISYFNQIFKD